MVSHRNIINGEGKKSTGHIYKKYLIKNKYPIRLCKRLMLACRDVFVLFCFFCFCKQTVQCYKCTLLSSYINYTCPPPENEHFFVFTYVYIYRYPKQAYLKRNTCSTPVSLLVFGGLYIMIICTDMYRQLPAFHMVPLSRQCRFVKHRFGGPNRVRIAAGTTGWARR